MCYNQLNMDIAELVLDVPVIEPSQESIKEPEVPAPKSARTLGRASLGTIAIIVAPEAIDLSSADSCVESDEKSEPGAKHDAVVDMVNTFINNRRVESAIAKYRKKSANLADARSDRRICKVAGSYRLISREEEKELFIDIDKGVELYESGIDLDKLPPDDKTTVLRLVAAQQVVYLTNLRWVISIANDEYGEGYGILSKDDLYQAGTAALSKSITSFDVSKGFRFSTFATKNIRWAIQQEIMDQSRAIYIPVGKHRQHRSVVQKLDRLMMLLGREPSEDEASEYVGMAPDKIADLLNWGANNLLSIDTPITDEPGRKTFAEFIVDETNDIKDATDAHAYREMIDLLVREAKLDAQTIMVMGLRYGVSSFPFGDFKVDLPSGLGMTYSEAFERAGQDSQTFIAIGSLLGLPPREVRSIEEIGRTKLAVAACENQLENFWETGITKKSNDSYFGA